MGIPGFILSALLLCELGMVVFALVHAIRQRSDAFPAVDKLTKPVWLAILVASLGGLLLTRNPVNILSIAAIVATGVYLADVRPKVDEVQRGPRW
ncbi:DUF2516 family protein [Nocardia sp. NBC_01327]|uniref:DUF2516 family protein n=1 Tax=unclassified Nocardia TaxID=2637762 RepID=UPI002E11CBE8|nr:DUF2516 family protein [Nocardia sp. NBC_01327]